MKTLVAYFSASGETKKLATTLAGVVGGDLFEIRPETPYTDADLNWNDKKSRSTIEMKDISCRPAIAGIAADVSQYDTIYIGFPIWWYEAPRIVQTFLESCDLTGKTVSPLPPPAAAKWATPMPSSSGRHPSPIGCWTSGYGPTPLRRKLPPGSKN